MREHDIDELFTRYREGGSIMIPAGPDAARQVSRNRRRVRLAFVGTATILAVAVPGVAFTMTTPRGDIGSDPSIVDPGTSSSPSSPPSPSASNNLPDASPSATVAPSNPSASVPAAGPSDTVPGASRSATVPAASPSQTS